MDDLDKIPWNDLTHAYGSAGDVPGLLRALKTAPPDVTGESPLWHLFGNIWHQGTVYEATAYAVPFLVDLAVDIHTPDRLGILALLGDIAHGSSYRDVHGDLLNERDFESKRNTELLWVQRAHDSVAVEFSKFVEMTHEPGEVRFAAAAVLARLTERGAEAAAVLRRLLRDEKRSVHRAGLLLLLGASRDGSQETLSVLGDAVRAGEALERHAAAFSIVRLNVEPMPDGAREAIMEGIPSRELEDSLQDLPWAPFGPFDPVELFPHLDAAHQNHVIDDLISSVEAGEGTAGAGETLIQLLFPQAISGPTHKLAAGALSARQHRAVRAIYHAMRGGERVFYGHFPSHGLPDMMREWRELAGGDDPTPVDESLPLLAAASHPRHPVAPRKLKIGQRVIHRYFGPGTVVALAVGRPFTAMTVHFDEEGVKELSLPSDGS